MALAIFGIKSNGLNLAATLFLLMLVVLWLALIVYTYLDARRRISDPFLVACATVASLPLHRYRGLRDRAPARVP